MRKTELRFPTRGFRSMSPEQARAIASKGGKASRGPGGNGHAWTSAEAKAAARKALVSRRARVAAELTRMDVEAQR